MHDLHDLLAQLACGGHDKGTSALITQEGFDQRNGKRRGFPGSGLRGAKDIAPFQSYGYGLRLNRGWGCVIHVL